MMFCNARHIGALLPFLVIAACSRSDTRAEGDTPAAARTPSGSGAASVKATGDTIVVEMWTDPNGNYFKPAKLEAHRGDVVRFTLKAGVHNVHFLPDSNAGKKDLPSMSEFLQLPGQTYDLIVAMPEGDYYFQCDPHALLGMVGRLEVEGEEEEEGEGEGGSR